MGEREEYMEKVVNMSGFKRFWVFGSLEYEAGVGMQDFIESVMKRPNYSIL